MASPEYELRMAMRAMLETEEFERPTGSVLDQLRELYGSNQAIATEAGLPTAAQAVKAHRQRYPRARKTTLERISRDARRNRQSFLRNLQRYEDGTRRPKTMESRLASLRDEGVEEREALGSLGGIAQRFVDEGVTVSGSFEITVSDDTRDRGRISNVGIRAFLDGRFVDAVAEKNWARAAGLFFNDGWSRAYGIGRFGGIVDSVSGLELDFGLAGASTVDGISSRRRTA
jgi:hypothetical protein